MFWRNNLSAGIPARGDGQDSIAKMEFRTILSVGEAKRIGA